MEKKNHFEMFDEGVHPHQEKIEGFASARGSTNAEYWFRAGWMAHKATTEADCIIVRKEDLTLNWYKETKAALCGG